MKHLLTLLLTAATLTATAQDTKPAKATATVLRMSGLYVFIQSQPVAEYEVLGTIEKGGFVMTGKAKEMAEIMLRRANKQYPNADGIIFDDLGMYKVTVIKFK